VRQASDLVRPLADQASISIVLNADPLPVLADPDRIVQTLTNLIGNAIKFSPPESTIQVRAEKNDGMVAFHVLDQGRGIPADKLETVFERFKQVDASDARDKGGSGLGLAICRSIVQHHGGQISVRSEPGRGSEFVFTIPSLISEPGHAALELNPDRLVYLCDDEEEAREIMRMLLTAHGYAVKEFATGAELLDAMRHERPDLLLLDLFMPDMNGWETLAAIKSDPTIADVPVVVVSVLSSEECDSPFVDLCGWLNKPLEEGDLLDAVRKALGGTGQPRTLLIVEDDADLARVIGASFERYGMNVLTASTGKEAIQIAQTIVPDLVILDLLLPDVDGFGVIDWVKDHGLWRTVPLVVYSAQETTPSQQQRLRLGPTQFLTKSRIGPAEFERRVLHLLDDLSLRTARAETSTDPSNNRTPH
jgi:CheY-like chemotaxis protein